MGKVHIRSKGRSDGRGAAAPQVGRSSSATPARPSSPYASPWVPLAALAVVTAALVAWHLRAGADADEAPAASQRLPDVAALDPYAPGDAEQLAQAGRALTPAQAERLEASLGAGQGDHALRTQLVGYYAGAGVDRATRARLGLHVAWFARHAPEAAVLGTPWARLTPADPSWAEVEAAFATHTDRADASPATLRHAARFFGSFAPERAIALLERGAALEPANPDWAYAIGRAEAEARALASSEASGLPAEQAAPVLALVQPELVDEAAGVPFQDLADAATRALADGQRARAAAYANHALESARRHVEHHAHGYVFHHCNIVLGRLALRLDHVALAEAYLLRATRALRSPRLSSGGPDTTLAAELLARGRRDAVLTYLERVGHLWPAGREGGHLARWRAEIKDDRVPTFDKSL